MILIKNYSSSRFVLVWEAVCAHYGVVLVGAAVFAVEFFAESIADPFSESGLPSSLFYFSICCVSMFGLAFILQFSKENDLRNDIAELFLYDAILHAIIFTIYISMSAEEWPSLRYIDNQRWDEWNLEKIYLVSNITIQVLKFCRLAMPSQAWPVFGFIGLASRRVDRAGLKFVGFVLCAIVAAWLLTSVKGHIRVGMAIILLVVLACRVALDSWENKKKLESRLEQAEQALARSKAVNDDWKIGELPPNMQAMVQGLIFRLKNDLKKLTEEEKKPGDKKPD